MLAKKSRWKKRTGSYSAQKTFQLAHKGDDGKQQKPCYRCGSKHAAQLCKLKQEKCHSYSKVGHIAQI